MTDSELVRLIDDLEDRAAGYLTLDTVRTAAEGADLARAVADDLILVDYRQRVDGTRVTLCRLNRHHPLVVQLTSW